MIELPKEFQKINDSYFSGLQKQLLEQTTAFARKKEEIIRNVFAKAGYSHYLENLENKRFQRVYIELENTGFCDSDEHYYIDNGTDEGHLLCTISTNTIFDGNNCRIEITTKEFPYKL